MTWMVCSQKKSSVIQHRKNPEERKVITGHSKLLAGMTLRVRKYFIMALRKTLLQDITVQNSKIQKSKNKVSYFNTKRSQHNQDPKYFTSLIV